MVSTMTENGDFSFFSLCLLNHVCDSYNIMSVERLE